MVLFSQYTKSTIFVSFDLSKEKIGCFTKGIFLLQDLDFLNNILDFQFVIFYYSIVFLLYEIDTLALIRLDCTYNLCCKKILFDMNVAKCLGFARDAGIHNA